MGMKMSLLDPEGIARIHAGALRILEEVGVEVPHPQTLSRLADLGARVEQGSGRARIPSELVSTSLASAGKSYTLYGRDPQQQARFGVGERNYNSIAGEAYWLDEETGQRRFALLGDVDTAARVGDALGNINIVGAMADPHDAPVAVQDVLVLERLLHNTTKPFTFWFNNRASARLVCEMLIALRGNEAEVAARPPTYNFLEPISPLRFPFQGVDLLWETSRFPLPVSIGPMAQAGATAPVTLAGTLALEHAEILAGLCITQAIRPGTPVCYGGIPHVMDMRTTQMVFAGPEQALMAVAMTELGKSLKLPVYVNVGLTDSKAVDAQAGMEAGITLAAGVLAGADIFGHMGICGVDQATSLAMLVMQDELIGYVERLARGLVVDADTLALEVIASVGPGGNFLAEEHTVEHLRSQQWFPRLLDRSYFEAWAQDGGREMAARCREELGRILATHRPQPLAPELGRELARIAAAAARLATGETPLPGPQ